MASVALAKHHRTSRSAGTAPRSRGLDLAGARFALERAWPTRAREKGWCRDRRTIYDWPHQRVLRRQSGLEWISVMHNVVRRAQGRRIPRKVAILPGEVSFAARNYQNGLPAPLARDRGAPHTQLGDPVTRATLGARLDQVSPGVLAGYLPATTARGPACAPRARRACWACVGGLGTSYSASPLHDSDETTRRP